MDQTPDTILTMGTSEKFDSDTTSQISQTALEHTYVELHKTLSLHDTRTVDP